MELRRVPRPAGRSWYPANRAMGRDLFLAGIAISLGMLALGAATPAGAEPAMVPLLAVILGPILAAALRQLEWQYVFFACAAIISLNFH